MRVVAGRYQLENRIGRGGSGRVWVAHDRESQRRVAVKALGLPGDADEFHQQRLIQEFDIVAGLTHPNIVRMFEAVEDGDDLFLVMEFLDGRSLDQVLRHGRLTHGEACGIGAQLCAALSQAHATGVVHRDLKPSNVMLCADGRVVIMDFGIAKDVSMNRQLTASGVMIGTPLYMAPEMILGTPLSPSADLYSLGCLMYEMVGGALPFPPKGQLISLVLAKVSADAPSLGTVSGPDVPPELVALVDQLLARDPLHRTLNASRVGLLLEQWGVPPTRLASIVAGVPDDGPPPMSADADEDEDEDQALTADRTFRGAHGLPMAAPEVPQAVTNNIMRPWWLADPEVQGWVASAAEAPAERTSEHSKTYRRVADHTPRAATPPEGSRPPVRRHRSARVESRFHEAVALAQRGEHVAALRLHEDIAHLRAGLLGSSHPLTLASRYWVAWCLTELGELQRSDELFRRVSEQAGNTPAVPSAPLGPPSAPPPEPPPGGYPKRTS
ncbi:serine/threonine-protein kinase [Embleya sp. NBC_00888]|uniref:serine/threonine-protein kinase n=1 Tax=Embleya sp. NBC_00888 TaxID=2975960 RepID=UPI00386D42F1|nr:serine/threonine-protein kinase [Embleya sp. NBC_00888]